MTDQKTYVKTINRRYLENRIRHASQSEIVAMLYDGALSFLGQMKQAILEEDYSVKDDAFGRAQAIIQELQNGINFGKGGEIATSLASVYSFMLKHLFESNLNMDVSGIEAVEEMIRELRTAWQEAAEEQKKATNAPLHNQSENKNIEIQAG